MIISTDRRESCEAINTPPPTTHTHLLCFCAEIKTWWRGGGGKPMQSGKDDYLIMALYQKGKGEALQ